MALTPNLVVSDVNFDTDWDDLFSAYWTSWKTPLQAVGQLTFPGIGKGGHEEATGFATTKQEYLAAARANPDQHWLKVEDLSRKSQGLSCIVGGGVWMHHRDNPFRSCSQGHPTDEEWLQRLPGNGFEPGSERDGLAREFYSQMWSWRQRLMTSAHAYGQGLWVIPEYRHLGAAAALMDSWTSTVDGLGLESYLEGTSMSTPLYLNYGFIVISHPTMVFRRKNPSPDWVSLVRDMQAHPISIMWRPKGGVYVEGETVLPWQGKPREYKL
ncbi:hypothetical protein DL771_003769 [Monosporascus sp. 5C6A]|nr:hypothetical protein DL771_003769 [Monosporascus sp. 5C6A]